LAGSPSTPPSSTFVVRLWREGTVEGPRWRGRIEHLQSGESRGFVDAEGLLAFVGRFAAVRDQADQPAKKDG
jgi:hypothetical protein